LKVMKIRKISRKLKTIDTTRCISYMMNGIILRACTLALPNKTALLSQTKIFARIYKENT
jgi:hypothetical protein